jgi:thiol:disulfide interchange protein
VWPWGVFTRAAVIACWILAAVVLALLYLRGVRRSPVPRLVAAGSAVMLALWLGTGLRGYRLGELEAFLPPAAEDVLLARAGTGELPWRVNDYEGTLAAGRASGRPVIIDFTGYTCTNCRWMEANMFPRGEVRELLGRYERVRLYTDGRGEPYQRQQRLQEELYGTVALPYYAVLAPDGRTVATFLGMTRDSRDFVQFLSDGLGSLVHSPAAH